MEASCRSVAEPSATEHRTAVLNTPDCCVSQGLLLRWQEACRRDKIFQHWRCKMKLLRSVVAVFERIERGVQGRAVAIWRERRALSVLIRVMDVNLWSMRRREGFWLWRVAQLEAKRRAEQARRRRLQVERGLRSLVCTVRGWLEAALSSVLERWADGADGYCEAQHS